jgi:hypothetical protein
MSKKGSDADIRSDDESYQHAWTDFLKWKLVRACSRSSKSSHWTTSLGCLTLRLLVVNPVLTSANYMLRMGI